MELLAFARTVTMICHEVQSNSGTDSCRSQEQMDTFSSSAGLN